MSGDNALIYVKWDQKLQPGNYIVQSGDTDPATGSRSRIMFFPENGMITRMRRCDFNLLVKRLRTKVVPLDTSEVPDNIRAVFEQRQAKADSAKSAAKKPPARKAKKPATKKGE